jgi:hypothetical protein
MEESLLTNRTGIGITIVATCQHRWSSLHVKTGTFEGRSAGLWTVRQDAARLGSPHFIDASPIHIRLKISEPRILNTWPFGATYLPTQLVATVPGLTPRPDQTIVTAQSDVHVLEVWNVT